MTLRKLIGYALIAGTLGGVAVAASIVAGTWWTGPLALVFVAAFLGLGALIGWLIE